MNINNKNINTITENDIDIENEIDEMIIKKDIIGKLYRIFGDVEETVIHDDKKKIFSYKNIRDDYNVFIMIDKKLLQKILEKIPVSKKRKISLQV
jgi:hypothetical protein